MGRHRPDTKSSSPLLPFHDNTEFLRRPSPDRSPSAFISYSHETPEHDERVLNLAMTLRAEGVACEVDAFQVSPPEGWPIWMQKQTKNADFVIVVCTETYARRFVADETPGKGKGATWEGRLIQQDLYDAGENRRIIPIVFDPADVAHIPSVLRSATYYDLSQDSGYSELHRALTNQPRVEKRPVGPMPKRLPDLDSGESDVSALLHLCPDSVPLEVIANVLGQHATTGVVKLLQRLLEAAVLKIEGDAVQLTDRSVDGIPPPSGSLAATGLQASLEFFENHRSTAGRAQVMNIIALAKAADIHTASAQVSRTFRAIQSLLKSFGNKRLVLEVARRSIEASKVPGRGTEQVKDEAVAAICGVSWVYQRTGRLSEALAEAERSLNLGLYIHWDRNTAFCHKCLGRLKRMVFETARDDDHRTVLINDSVKLLHQAIDEFTKLELEAEVGDCYSLLARSYLAANDRRAARDAIREANRRLVDSTTKDYLDLRIVEGDLLLHSNRRSADSAYTEVLKRGIDDDAQRSEIMARAHLRRGMVRADLGYHEKALADYRQAARIWDTLDDPSADFAYWEVERTATWMDKYTERLLAREPIGVRVRAARIIGTEVAERPVGRAHRQQLTEQYLRGVVSRAKGQLVRDRPVW